MKGDLMLGNNPQLHHNVIALMQAKAKKVCSGELPMRDLIELGALFTKSHLTPPDRSVTVNLIDEIANSLSTEGDERNVRAYLKTLAIEIEGPVESPGNRLGRTA